MIPMEITELSVNGGDPRAVRVSVPERGLVRLRGRFVTPAAGKTGPRAVTGPAVFEIVGETSRGESIFQSDSADPGPDGIYEIDLEAPARAGTYRFVIHA